jgi:hypothetical protein
MSQENVEMVKGFLAAGEKWTSRRYGSRPLRDSPRDSQPSICANLASVLALSR